MEFISFKKDTICEYLVLVLCGGIQTRLKMALSPDLCGPEKILTSL
ncbi:hypothetical protein [Desulfomarina sp.]